MRGAARLRNGLGAAVLAVILQLAGAGVAAAAEPSDLLLLIQQQLVAFGYNPGTPDGLAGTKTTQAIKQFQAEFRDEVTGAADATTAAELEVPFYSAPLPGAIYVLADDVNDISYQMLRQDQLHLPAYLLGLSRRSLAHIDMDGAHAKTVVFVLDGDLKPGDVITTQFENIRLKLPKYYENFYYEIKSDTPVHPLVIVNQVEAGWELQITHRMFRNGELVAEKRTRAAP